MQESDYNLILTIQVMMDSKISIIEVGLYDTPLQLAYKFCQDNKIQLIEFRKIKIEYFTRAAIDSSLLLENRQRLLNDSFQKYFHDVEHTIPYKDIYLLKELLGEYEDECPTTKEIDEQPTLSVRNDQITQIQQKLYKMYILSPDAKQDRENVTEPLMELTTDESSKRLRQLNFLQHILGEPQVNKMENLFFSNDQPPLFTKADSIDHSFQKSRIPSITTSTTIKHTTPIKTNYISQKKKSTVKKFIPTENNVPSLLYSKQVTNLFQPKSSFQPFNARKLIQSQNIINPRHMKSNSQSPLSFPARQVQPFIPNKSKSPLQKPKSVNRLTTSFVQCGPEKKVQQLLKRLITGNQTTQNQSQYPRYPNQQIVKSQNASMLTRFKTESSDYGNSTAQQSQNNDQEDAHLEELENKKSQQLYKIFQQIDSDQDGLISPQKVELSNLSDEILNFLLELLYEIDSLQMEVNYRQFCKMFEKYFQKMALRQKQQFLTTQVN